MTKPYTEQSYSKLAHNELVYLKEILNEQNETIRYTLDNTYMHPRAQELRGKIGANTNRIGMIDKIIMITPNPRWLERYGVM